MLGSGNVGIGEAAPWEKLSLPFNPGIALGSSTYSFKLQRASTGELITTFSDTYDASTARIDFTMRKGAGAENTPLSILGSGNVGIGTTIPSAKLEVSDTSSANGLRVTVGSGAYSGNVVLFGVSGQSNGYYITKDAANNIQHIWDGTGGIERMRINGAGAVSVASSTFTIGGAQVATQAYVTGLGYAPLASPALTGTPTHGGIEIGYRDIPRVTGGIERGKCNAVAAGFTVDTGPAAGSAYSVYNDSAAAFTITQGAGLTLRLGGTTTTGNRTLAPRGFATIWFNSTTEAVIQGSGVS